MPRHILAILVVLICLPSSLHAGPLSRIYIVPRDFGLVRGGTQQLALIGEDADGNEVSPGAVTWSANAAAGTVTLAGLFTAGSVAGKYVSAITATAGGFTAIANVEIYAIQLQAGYTLERSLGSLNGGSIGNPVDIAFDGAGNLYLLSQSDNSINKFDSSGRCTARFPLAYVVGDNTSLAVAATGIMYVADATSNIIRKYDSSGSFVTQWGSTGTGNGQFSGVIDIAVDSIGRVYTCDSQNFRVQIFSSSGAFIQSWPQSIKHTVYGYPENTYSYTDALPVGISIDGTDKVSVVVVDSDHYTYYYAYCISQFDSLGTLLSSNRIISNCYANSATPERCAVAVGSGGTIYGAYGQSAGKFTFDGSSYWIDAYPWTWSGDGGLFYFASGVAVSTSGSVYVSDRDDNCIQIFDSSGAYLSSWRSSGSDKGQFNSPSAVAVDSHGNVFVGDTANRRVQKFDSNGLFIRELASQQQNDGAFAWPSGLTIDSQDNLYISDCVTPRILVYGSNATISSIWSLPSPDGVTPLPIGIIRDSTSSNSFVADAARNFMDTFSSAGTCLASWLFGAGTSNGYAQTPAGIALDSSRLQYVTDYGNNRVQKFNGGVFQSKWGTAGTGNGQFQGPAGICIDSSDIVYVADSGNGRVQELSTSGTCIAQLGSAGFGAYQFSDPEAVAIDASGNLWIADTGNHRLVKLHKNLAAAAVTITGPTTVATYSTNLSTVDLSGTTTGEVAAVSWSNDRGGYGYCTGTASWSAAAVPLKSGQNVLTVTARDASGGTASDTITITCTAPSVTINSPTTNHSCLRTSTPMSLSGTAADDRTVYSVKWTNDRGGMGTATGTTSWSIASVALQAGRNVITVTARDAASGGNTGSATLVVYYATGSTTTIPAAKQTSGGEVYLTNQSVSAVFGDCFYIETVDRASALKVVLPSIMDLPSVGSVVDVGGTVKTGNGERYIDGAAKTKS